jgi:hypothetical protein
MDLENYPRDISRIIVEACFIFEDENSKENLRGSTYSKSYNLPSVIY